MSSLGLFKTRHSALMTILISILVLMKDTIIELITQDYVFLIVTTTITLLSSYTSNLLLYTI